ncbi:hypothetical protein SAMN04487788_3189 [Microbacterium testaceum StLB037]|uniref:Uncharacterized protein n=1 Tax=Microbacterium testaceum (strain StLB037) TaxID=979556 RepID=A0A1H0S4C0_MICTS|nr:hypothetical protein SAMN04487788_3189 [Microbacterium testaceum StLB037]
MGGATNVGFEGQADTAGSAVGLDGVAMKIISSWFYTHGDGELGAYAQMRGHIASEGFRDVYRRCIAVFFATARLVEPTARLVLFSNVTWDGSASRVSHEVEVLLRRLGVEIVQIPYSHEPPATWPAAWRNQFFVLDVLKWAAQTLLPDDEILVLDSDMVWTGSPRASNMWRRVREDGGIALSIDYAPDESVNSMSRREMTQKMAGLDDAAPPLAYCGGEFVALSGKIVQAYYLEAAAILLENIDRSAGGTLYAFEEAHVLSVANSRIGIQAGSANFYVKRLWTQPLKYKNVRDDDVALPLWHLPAEKRYGIRRLYKRFTSDALSHSVEEAGHGLRPIAVGTLGACLGIPKNSPFKWVRDVSRASWGKLRINR